MEETDNVGLRNTSAWLGEEIGKHAREKYRTQNITVITNISGRTE